MTELLGYMAMVCIGILLGSAGAGGSMLAMPVLIYLFSMGAETASAYSLFLVGATSLAGAFIKARSATIAFREGLLFGIPSLMSTFVSRTWIIQIFPEKIKWFGTCEMHKEDVLITLFSLLMIAASISLLSGRGGRDSGGERNVYFLIPVGIAVGTVAGLVGAGGGFLILPALVFFAGIPFHRAVSTTLCIIAANSLTGFFGATLLHPLDWKLLALMTLLAMTGLLIGHRSRLKMPSIFSGRSFGWLSLLIAVIMLFKNWVM